MQGVLEVVKFDLRLRTVIRELDYGAEFGRHPVEPAGQVEPEYPYVVIDTIEGGDFDGPPLANPDSCAQVIRQLTAVGQTAESVAIVMDRIRRTLLGRNAAGAFLTDLNTATVKVLGRWSLGDGGTDSDNRLSQKAERFVFYVEMA